MKGRSVWPFTVTCISLLLSYSFSLFHVSAADCEFIPLNGRTNCRGYADRHGKLQLDGIQLVDMYGDPIQLRGVSSHGLQWFKDCVTLSSLTHLIEVWGVTVFRASVYIDPAEDGYPTQPNYFKSKLADIINWCETLGIYVIVDWHVHTPSGDPNYYLDTPGARTGMAMDFWRYIANTYKTKTHVIYEIANEPSYTDWDTILLYHNVMIDEIRKIDPETIIIAGTPFWSSQIYFPASEPVDNPYNVMYTFHFYAASHQYLYDIVDEYIDSVPLFVTEWAATDYTTTETYDTEEAEKFLTLFSGTGNRTVVSWCVWQYSDKDEELASLLSFGACAAQDWESTTCLGTYMRNYFLSENLYDDEWTCMPPEPTLTPTISLSPSSYPTISAIPTATEFPTVLPTASPTVSPTHRPSLRPTPFAPPAVCVPGDRAFCHNKGHCAPSGLLCVCDDYKHYWPSERCQFFHYGRELEEGLFCYPNQVDDYCSWLGVCSEDGLSCECFDSAHRVSETRCGEYQPRFNISHGSSCEPGTDRGYCYNNGKCDDTGSGCICDDPLHFWASERCDSYHHGPELDPDQCCEPNSRDYYCSWLGTCDAVGGDCVCDSPGHRLPSERCQTWYDSIYTTSAPTSTEAISNCPDLLVIEDNSGTSDSKNSSDGSVFSKNNWPYAVVVLCVFFLVGYMIIRQVTSVARYSERPRESDDVIVTGEYQLGGDDVSALEKKSELKFMDSPIYFDNEPCIQRRRKSSLLKLKDSYEELDTADSKGVNDDRQWEFGGKQQNPGMSLARRNTSWLNHSPRAAQPSTSFKTAKDDTIIVSTEETAML